jgi:hypothetical protein
VLHYGDRRTAGWAGARCSPLVDALYRAKVSLADRVPQAVIAFGNRVATRILEALADRGLRGDRDSRAIGWRARHTRCSIREAHTHPQEIRMHYDEESGAIKFVAGVLVGAVLGATVALLAAPQSGKKTRRRLVKAVSSARDNAGDRWEDLTDDVRSAVDAGRKRIRL